MAFFREDTGKLGFLFGENLCFALMQFKCKDL